MPSMPPPSIPTQKRKSFQQSRKLKRLLRQSTKYAEQQKHLKFFIIDCRPIEQYEAGHLPCAFHLDPKLVM